MIRSAVLSESDIITELVRKTIKAVYPKYYPEGAVKFFLAHHKPEKIASDIEAGKVYVILRDGVIAGTVTIDRNGIESGSLLSLLLTLFCSYWFTSCLVFGFLSQPCDYIISYG